MSNRVKIFGRASFLRVDRPEKYQGQGDPRYSGNVILEDPKEVAKVKAAMRAAAVSQWGEAKADAALKSLIAGQKTALVDGNTKAEYPGYEGNMVVQAHSKANQPPTLVQTLNGENVKLDNETQSVIYSGCYVNAIIEFWAQDNQYGKRINAQLAGLQFVRDGESFAGGRAAATDDFAPVETEDAPFEDDFV